MQELHRGKQSVVFPNFPAIEANAAIVGKKEGEGPLREDFDQITQDTKLNQASWEKAESELQKTALELALGKASLNYDDLDVLFAGDLLNQCISSSFAVRDTKIPFLGLYGACSTMAESLLLAASFVNAGYARRAGAITSSHFASAERQYRFPLGYGGQRTPTAQWTVTGSGCCIVSSSGKGPFVECATVGKIQDFGIKDANNMGAAMAPAAVDTIRQHFEDFGTAPKDYDKIVTGDLGKVGQRVLLDLLQTSGIDLGERHMDCGIEIYDCKKQDTHAGGSGCGCSASVLSAFLLKQLSEKKWKRILFVPTGALLSKTSYNEGQSVPGIAHALLLEAI
mgnify:CR=1 FL=1